MKKLYFHYVPYFTICCFCLLLLGNTNSLSAQVVKTFKERTSQYTPTKKIYNIKGDFTMFGNTNLSPQNLTPTAVNNDSSMKYVDIDTDSNTLNSSSAELKLSTENGAVSSCSNIIYAGLYWTGTKVSTASLAVGTKTLYRNQVKIKGPSVGTYTTVTAVSGEVYTPNSGSYDDIYVGYAEITDYVKTYGVGNYTIADIALREGTNSDPGYSGGWGIIVVYENTQMKNRDVTIFDGYAYVKSPNANNNSSQEYTLPISGFNSVQSGNVGIKLGLMASEGDVSYTGDYISLQQLNTGNYTKLVHPSNPSRTASATNFFDSSIVTGTNTRNPSFDNNTGMDISMFDVPNTGNALIGNNQTSTNFRYGTNYETYTIFALAMAVDAYVPEIEGVLTATSINGSPAGTGPYTVLPGQNLGYKVQIKNKGTEPILNSKIVIPIPYNATFVAGSLAKSINFTPLPAPNTLTYEPTIGANGSIVWDIGTLPVVANKETVLAELTFTLKSTENCALLKNSNCSNVIQVNGLLSGKGQNSLVTVTDKNLILGYTTSGSCIGTSISAPLQTTIDATNYINTNCQSTPPVIAFTFCNGASSIPITDVSGSFPPGSRFYNTYPVVAGTTIQYDINNPFPATLGTSTYYAIPPGATSGCYFQFTISIESITTTPTVVTPLNYCVGDIAVPLTATPTKPEYTLYYYETANSTGQQSFTPPTTTVGQYTYYVAEGKTNACIGPKKAIVVNINAKPTVIITNPLPICAPAATTNLTTSAITAGSTAGLTYTYWTDLGATIPYPNFAAATPGTYYIKGTNATNCYDIKPVVVSKSTIIITELIASHIDVTCFGKTTGSITVNNATGGVGSYTYSWKKNTVAYPGTTQTLINLGAGSYEITATDVNGCSGTLTIIILEPSAPLALAPSSKTDVFCFGGSTGSVTVGTVTNAIGTVTYSWKNSLNVEVGTTPTVLNLPSGTYTVTVTDNCSSKSDTIIIDQPTAIAIAITAKADVNCYNEVTGAIDLTITGGTPNYTYTWKKGGAAIAATSQDLTAIGAGTYEVTVTDSKGCSAVKTIIIDQPATALSITVTAKTDVNCYNEVTGAIDLTISGGTPNYTYTWKKGGAAIASTSQDLTAIGAGTYEVTVTDSKGCSAVKTIIIDQPATALSITVTAKTDVNCYNEVTGAIDLTISGGTPNYTYTWKKGGTAIASTSQDLTAIGAGTYEVTVTDSKGCSAVKTIIIDQPTAALTIAVTAKTDVNCYNEVTGAIDLTVTGGTPNYTYTWKKGGAAIAATSQDLTAIGAGTYEVTVTDSKGCSAVKTIVIDQPTTALTCSITQNKAVSSNGLSDGEATVTPIGGNGGYTYAWDNGETTAKAVGLTAGLHDVTVTDAKGCTTNCTITISQPGVLSCSITQDDPAKCFGDSNGKATVTAIGGNGNYTYKWDNNETTAQAIGLTAGLHSVIVTDKLGYTTTCTVNIGQPQKALSAVKSQVNVACGGNNTGSATVTVSGGNSPYTYVWNTNPVQNGATATNLLAGNYSVKITDAKGCSITEAFIILDGDSIKPIINPLPETSTINCPEVPVFAQATATDNNGTIASLTFTDTTTPGNCTGSYTKTRTWTAKDACGNISLPVSQTIIVQDNTAPTWVTQIGTLNKTVECNNQQALAEAQNLFPTAADACDTDVLNIDKVSGKFTASQTCSNAGTYTNTWTVKDDCGNISGTFTQVITIQDTTAPTFSGTLPSDVTVSCDAIPAPAEMTASDNCNGDLPIVFTETKSDIQNQCATNYTLTRKWTTSDCGGNTTSYTQIITVRDTTAPTGTAPADVANLQSIADIPVGSPSDITDAKDNCSATVNITVSDANNGGNGCDGSSYILTRTYTLTDCAGNKTELVQTFTVESKVSVTATASNVTCLGASDGSITVTSSAGSTVVIKNQNNEVVGNSNLPPGTYTVTATAAVNGENQTCSATATVVITEPNYKVKISGFIINIDTNTPIANVPVTLIPQGTTPGPILLRITGADGAYSFTGMAAGSYLVQVQDANLNSAYQLYPVDSSLFFTTLEDCVFQTHNFEYGKSTLPVLGDYVWYDTNGNGIQDEWYDANNDGAVTKNVPDENGAIDYSQWEWIDLNGDGSYAGPQNAGELNAGGFGNALSANVIVDGPNGYHDEVIVGIAGFWRNRPEQANPYGEYTIKLVRDANFDAVAATLGATGLVKVIPSASDKKITSKPSKTQMHTVCQTTSDSGYIVNVTPEDLVHLDIDFGVNCKEVKDIIANDDSAGPIAGVNHTTTNVLNVLPNDTIEGVVVTASDVIITTVTPNEFLQLNPDGSVDVLPNAPVGTLTMVYQICEADETSNCDTATVTVTIEAPVMTVTATAICINDVPYLDYVVTPTNFTSVNGVTIAWANSSNIVITTMTDLPLSGRVLWPGAVVDGAGNGVDWPGWIFENNRWIQGADGFESLRPTVNLTISVNPSETITVNYPPADPFCTSRPTFAIIANDDNAGPLSAVTAAIPNVLSVYTNDTLNGTAVNPADVTLTTVTSDPTGTLTLNPNGTVDVKANAPAGTYTLTYQICENADAGNCDTAIVTVIITAPAPVVANDDTFSNIGCNTFGLVGNVLSNDLKGTVPATLQLVNFTLLTEIPNTKTNPNITIDASGNINVSSLTPAGTYTYGYRICDKLNAENCDSAVITITVAPLGVINLTSEACNDDSTLIDLLKLLPENTPLTGQWIDTNGTNALQGGILNPFGLALGNYLFEYRIADATCPRNIAVTMAINDDCKVLPCQSVLVHNAFSPNGDGINDVFKIDNIDEITCYPGNSVEIYNRWGILIFETTDYNNTTNAFDGTSRGRTTVKQSDGLPTGTYFYIINYKSLDGNNVIQNNKLDGYLYLSK